jgi:predicted RecB family endonuclease
LQLQYDEYAFEERQERMVLEIVRVVRSALEEERISGKRLEALVQQISFSVAAIVDGTTFVEFADDHLVPVLGFAEGGMRDQLLISKTGGSTLHELVADTVRDQFD